MTFLVHFHDDGLTEHFARLHNTKILHASNGVCSRPCIRIVPRFAEALVRSMNIHPTCIYARDSRNKPIRVASIDDIAHFSSVADHQNAA